MACARNNPRIQPPSSPSFALITTLAFLALIAIALIAYVSIVSADRQATQNYSQGIKAQQIAEGGLDRIVSQLQSEITDPARSTNFVSGSGTSARSIYRPIAASNAIPERMKSLSGISGLNNIAKLSQPGVPFFTSPSAGSRSAIFASGLSSDIASLNGRRVSLKRWVEPDLVPVSATNHFPIPSWIFVGRDGPFIPTAGADLSASITNPQSVLGRYAYVVYDVSGLIDANVAGYPTSATGAAAGKGVLPWIDISSLPSKPDMNQLVTWRNASSAASGSSYASLVTNALATGFLQVNKSDTAFLNRQELITYFTSYGWTNALPYLTTFSREVNGPVWGPPANAGAAPYDYLDHQYKATTTATATAIQGLFYATSQTVPDSNVFILNPRVKNQYTDSLGFTRAAGEPLVKYRFPLSKLALLEKMQGTGTLSSTEIEVIQKYFGLDVAPDVTSSSGLYRHWNYPTANTAYPHTAGKILTLDEAAALKPGRDPDFFELLQAGILAGSLGKGGRGDLFTAGTPADPDLSNAYQLIRIGANIIDQWDADSFPTAITFNGWDFYGIEDLPYLSKAFLKTTSAVNMTTYVGSNLPVALYFEFWNPHRDLGNSTGNNLRPTQLRLVPAPGSTYSYRLSTVIGTTQVIWSPSVTNSLSGANGGLPYAGGAMSISSYVSSDYREPSLISSLKGAPAIPTTELSDSVVGIELAPYSLPAAGTTSASPITYTWPPPGGTQWYINIKSPSGFNYYLQYLGPDGTPHTYANWIGLNTDTAVNNPMYLSTYLPTISSLTADAFGWTKSDPRTSRFGIPFFNLNGASPPPTAGVSLKAAAGTTPVPLQIYNFLSFSGSSGTSVSTTAYHFRHDMWAVNDPTVPVSGASSTGESPKISPYYTDNDGTQRPGDYVDSYTRGHYPFYQNVAQSRPLPQGASSPGYVAEPARPVILNRPFQSVGELGYAFRDMPWKSLDLFSSSSPDSALLDLFNLSSAQVIAGHVNPNTAPAEVLSALLSGAALSWNANSTNTLSVSAASSVATQLRSVADATPFVSRADLVPLFMANTSVKAVSGNLLKEEREAVIRALAESANTRTWNFLIDIVAQSGSYPKTALTLDPFVVTGEHRYWLHIAIDRYTGQVVDKSLEIVRD